MWNPLDVFSDSEDVRQRRPVGRTCPRCGSPRYEPVDTEMLLGFVPDRECRDCRTLYHPPPPLIASIGLVVLAALVFALGISLGVWMILTALDPALEIPTPRRHRGGHRLATLLLGSSLILFSLVGGAACLATGIWGLWQSARAS